jgi:phage antirepressor YoqD-like protein
MPAYHTVTDVAAQVQVSPRSVRRWLLQQYQREGRAWWRLTPEQYQRAITEIKRVRKRSYGQF